PQRLANVVSPAVEANEPGCDGLHWLDNTGFRPCCDQHDRCYQKVVGGCSASSWYWGPWWGNTWQCSAWNTGVTCWFVTGGRGEEGLSGLAGLVVDVGGSIARVRGELP